MIFVIDRRECILRYKGGCLILQRKGKKDRQIPVKPLEQVIIYGNPQVEAAVYRVLGEAGVPVVMLPTRGTQSPAISGGGLSVQLPLRKRQHRLANDPASSLEMVKWFVLHKMDWPYYLALLILLFVVGAWTSKRQASLMKTEDPRCIVIDEAMGQLVTFFLLRPDWILLGLGFILFRALDILKPFVIKKAEKIPGGWGIMMDDVIAGLIASIFLSLYLILK